MGPAGEGEKGECANVCVRVHVQVRRGWLRPLRCGIRPLEQVPAFPLSLSPECALGWRGGLLHAVGAGPPFNQLPAPAPQRLRHCLRGQNGEQGCGGTVLSVQGLSSVSCSDPRPPWAPPLATGETSGSRAP